MDRMSSLWSVVFVLGLAWSGCSALQVDDASNSVSLSSEPPPLRKNRPNIVLVLVDDLGWNDVRCFGHGYHDTPNIDRLGAEGIRFTDAYANAPNCAPSRACLMTGQYTPRHGVYTVNSSARGKSKNRKLIPIPNTKRLDPEAQTMAEVLSAAGYRCGHFGKWHLGDDPLDQGFHVNAGGFAAGHPKSYFSPYQNPSLSDGPKGEHLTRRLTDETVGFIEEAVAVDKPFFAYVSLYAVHTPIQAAPEQSEPYRDRIKALADGKGRIGARAKYAAMVAAVDASVGRIRGAIERLGIANDTLIVFFSDNGGNGGITSMDPLRGAKGMLYEGGVRVPMIFHWPTHVTPSTNGGVVMGTDLLPTFASLAGVGTQLEVVDGIDLSPVIHGAPVPERPVFWHFPAYLEAGRRAESPWRTTPASAVRDGRFKLITFYEDLRLELYDLHADPGETTNLVEDRPETAERLHTLLEEWRRDIAAPIPREPNPGYQSR